MKDLRSFVKDEFIKKALFERSLYVDSIEEAKNAAIKIGYGHYENVVFKNSSIKDIFINQLLTIRPDTNIINCNCSLNKFNEIKFDNLSGLLVFNNVKSCKHNEIIEAIKTHKSILIC